VWDGDDLVHEITEGRETVTWEMEPGTFAPLAKIEGSRRYGVVTDHLGTPRLLVDEAGEVAWKAQLDIYGVARQDVMRTGCPWRWPGQYEDEETGLYYNRFRYYDPEAGRYVSQDPIGLLGGGNLYRYTTDPLRYIDPYGLADCDKLSRQTRELTQVELNHAYDRHAQEILGHAVNRSTDFQTFAELVSSARKSGLTFLWKTGSEETVAHLARVEGEYVIAQFFRRGDKVGDLATIFRPNPRQLSKIFGMMSRSGP
jgi:RHS repeat-associated protein